MRRIKLLAGVLLLALPLWLLSGCATPQEEQEEEEKEGAGLVTGHFVGDANPSVGQHTFVAIAASGAGEGEDMREVRAYLCDGQQINEWFTGSVIGNDLNLTSEGGAQLEGSLAPEAATGTITLDDGTRLTFIARTASGPAGLYNVSILSDGTFSGTSERGGRLVGHISQEADSQGEHELTATVTPPEGQSANLSSKAANASPGEARLIVSEDLHAVGGGARDGDRFGFRIVCSYEGSSGYL